MRSAITFGTLGLAFLCLAWLAARSLSPSGIPVIYVSLFLAVLFLALGILKFIYRRARLNYRGSDPGGVGYSGPDVGHVGTHGHGDGGGISGDGGAGHDGGGH